MFKRTCLFVSLLACLLVGWLAGWLAGSLVGWLVGWLVGEKMRMKIYYHIDLRLRQAHANFLHIILCSI